MQSQALSLDAARREYVARQQAIRNMPQNYSPLPVPGSTANTVPPAPDSRTPGAINMSQPPTMAASTTIPLPRTAAIATHSADTSAFTRSPVTVLPESGPGRGRPGDMSKYYTTIGPDGLASSLLLFGATPRLPIANVSTMAPTQKQRFEAMRAARQEMETITA